MKAAQMNSLLGRIVCLNFREPRGNYILGGLTLQVIEVRSRTVLLELPDGCRTWWRLGDIKGYYEKGNGITRKGGVINDRARSK